MQHVERTETSRITRRTLFDQEIIMMIYQRWPNGQLDSVVRFVRERFKKHRVFKLGNVPQVSQVPNLFAGDMLKTLSRNDNTQVLHDWHLKLGKTFGVFYGPDPWAMTVDLDLLQRVFVAEGSIHINATNLRLPYVSEINESLAQLRDDKWRQVRRAMAPSFTMHHLKSDNVLEEIKLTCDMFLDFIAAHRDSADPNKQRLVVDVHYGFKKFSLQVIFRVAFGCDYMQRLVPGERYKLIDRISDGSYMLHGYYTKMSIMFEWVQSLFSLFVPFTPLGSVISHVHSIIGESLKRRRALLGHIGKTEQKTSLRPAAERKAIDSLIERFDSGKISDDTLEANLFFLLLAGYETTANTLAALFYYLAANQRVQEQLRQSMANEDGEQSQYLDWVLQETLRLLPAVPVAVGRVLEHDIEHESQKLFKGTTVVADIWSIHRWPEYWVSSAASTKASNSNDNRLREPDDLEQFRPERFGEPAPEGVPAARYFAFGIGPRYCIGQNLAISEIKCIVKRVLVKYRVSLCESSPEKINAISPNFVHYIITHDIDLEFTEITSL